jgi:hypothetical protein
MDCGKNVLVLVLYFINLTQTREGKPRQVPRLKFQNDYIILNFAPFDRDKLSINFKECPDLFRWLDPPLTQTVKQ